VKSSWHKSAKLELVCRSRIMLSTCAAVLAGLVMSHRPQVLVYKLYGVGAFADAGSHTLDGAVAHITGDEHSRHAGFQQPRFTIQRPPARQFVVGHQVAPGEDESFFIAFQNAGKPVGQWRGADEDEKRSCGNLLCLAAGGTTDGEGFQAFGSESFDDIR